MINDVFVDFKELNPGIYNYFAIKDYIDSNNGSVKNMDNPDKYSYMISGAKIYSSRNIISIGETIYLILVRYNKDSYELVKDVQWHFEVNYKGISINRKGYLTVAESVEIDFDTDILVYTIVDDKRVEKNIRFIINDFMYKHNYIVHYFRYDRDYYGWNVWNWPDEIIDAEGTQYDFFEENDFGRLTGIDELNFKIRKYNWAESLHMLSFEKVKGKEIYVTDWDWDFYENFFDAMKAILPKIQCAIMDSEKTVTAYLTALKLSSTEFYLTCNGDRIDDVTYDVEGRKVIFNLPEDFCVVPDAIYEVKATNFFAPNKVTLRRVLDKFYYEDDDLGIRFYDNRAHIKLWAPTAKKVILHVYKNYDKKDGAGKSFNMKKDESSGVWSFESKKSDVIGKYYNFEVIINPDTDYMVQNFAVDPYAYAVSVNGIKGAIIDINDLNDMEVMPKGFYEQQRPSLESPTDAIIYEMSVRDFSADKKSGMKYNGKYLALTEEGTCLKGYPHIKTGIDHLVELGVNCVQLMPVYDFKTVDEANYDMDDYNWGYDPLNYNAPEGSYATDPYNPKNRVYELRKMIKKLHEKDIMVVMDVVYNHTYEIERFNYIVPGYYYRTNDLLKYTDGSGCGCELATERPMVRKFVLDSLFHWYDDYMIDGFRFDLMGLYDCESMEYFVSKLKKVNPGVLLYGEPWKGGCSGLSCEQSICKGAQKSKGYGVFNDGFRNAIRGDNNVPRPGNGYVTHDYFKKEEIFRGVMGSINEFTDNPTEVINYAACHDNYVLYDQIAANIEGNYKKPFKPHERNIDKTRYMENEIVNRAILAAGIILTSQGVSFIYSGDEFLSTKYGDHNSYNHSEIINMVEWQCKKDYFEVFLYYKNLIKLRKEHKAFRLNSRDEVNEHFQGLFAPEQVVAYIIKNNSKYDSWKNIIVIYNPYQGNKVVCIPDGEWKVYINGNKYVDHVEECKNYIDVMPLAIAVLYQEE